MCFVNQKRDMVSNYPVTGTKDKRFLLNFNIYVIELAFIMYPRVLE